MGLESRHADQVAEILSSNVACVWGDINFVEILVI